MRFGCYSECLQLQAQGHPPPRWLAVLSSREAVLYSERQVKTKKRGNSGFRIYVSKASCSQSSAKFQEKHRQNGTSPLPKASHSSRGSGRQPLGKAPQSAGLLTGGQLTSAESSWAALEMDSPTEGWVTTEAIDIIQEKLSLSQKNSVQGLRGPAVTAWTVTFTAHFKQALNKNTARCCTAGI